MAGTAGDSRTKDAPIMALAMGLRDAAAKRVGGRFLHHLLLRRRPPAVADAAPDP